jgi:hypothetical protein
MELLAIGLHPGILGVLQIAAVIWCAYHLIRPRP